MPGVATVGESPPPLPGLDLPLSLASPLIDLGDPARQDRDGPIADPGIYLGPGGAPWDRDLDDIPHYFCPGTIDDAPAGFSSGDYDCDDLDASVQHCNP